MNAIVKAGGNALEPRTFEEAMRFSQMLAKSTMVPKDFQNRPENVLVAVQWGRELGLGPLQALQNIAVINGRPSVWGDAMLALVRGSGLCEYIRETVEGEGDAMLATCRTKRRDDPHEVVSTFSAADAKAAGLWGKQGPWQQYRSRMLKLRARGFALRDAYPDVLRGVISAEEARDMPAEAPHAGPTIDAAPVRPAPAPVRDLDPLPEDEIDATPYQFIGRRGARNYRTPEEYIGAWQRTIDACMATADLTLLDQAREMNLPPMAAIAQHDQETVARVNQMLDEALGETVPVE